MFPCAGLCVYVVLLCYQFYWCLSFPEAKVALTEKVNCDVGTLPLWDFQFMLANMKWMSSPSLNSSVSLAAPKGEKMLGMPLQSRGLLYLCMYSCQGRLWSESALSVLAESWHRPWYSSQLFQAWIDTTVPVLTLDNYWNDSITEMILNSVNVK